jgi:hypothetical protein
LGPHWHPCSSLQGCQGHCTLLLGSWLVPGCGLAVGLSGGALRPSKRPQQLRICLRPRQSPHFVAGLAPSQLHALCTPSSAHQPRAAPARAVPAAPGTPRELERDHRPVDRCPWSNHLHRSNRCPRCPLPGRSLPLTVCPSKLESRVARSAPWRPRRSPRRRRRSRPRPRTARPPIRLPSPIPSPY